MDPVEQSPGPDLTGVVDSVMHLFGEVMSRDAVCAIVEHCGGDLTQAIDIIVNMSEESSVSESTGTPTSPKQNIEPTNNAMSGILPASQNLENLVTQKSTPIISYSGVSQARGAYPKQQPRQVPMNTQNSIWTLQTQQIVGYHKEGSRTLILMRGLPGSGKSFLAKALVDVMCPGMNYRTFIFSTDDFFMCRGQYNYNKRLLPEAHTWNLNRVLEAIGRGVSPIFVDNTNIEIYHMEPYVRAAVKNGYIIEVLEPNTPWAKKVGLLARKNAHEVPVYTLKRLLESFQNGVSGVYLIRSFGLSYPGDKVPPVKRNYPVIMEPDIQHDEQNTLIPEQAHQSQISPLLTRIDTTMPQNVTTVSEPRLRQEITLNRETDKVSNHTDVPSSQTDFSLIKTPLVPSTQEISTQQHPSVDPIPKTSIASEQETCTISPTNMNTITDDTEIQPHNGNDPVNKLNFVKLEDMRKQLEQIEKLEEEWENGDAWNDDTKTEPTLIENASAIIPKPPRNASANSTDSDRFLPAGCNYNDWSKISMFMPSWYESQPTNLLDSLNVKVETATTGTSVEFGDTDVNIKNLKVLIGTPRDINFYYMGLNEEKIPNKRMLDKSSMTNDHDHIAVETARCKNEEKHFVAFRKLFKNISKVELRDIFDKCVGDVNWAVDIVLDGMANNQLHTVGSEDVSDAEEFEDEQCDCLAAYNVIPSINTQPKTIAALNDPSLTEARGTSAALSSSPTTPKLKKEKNLSESSIQLKRQIEQNVVISDSHYSDHCLKIRKMRRGEVNDGQEDLFKEETEEICVASTSSAAEPVVESYLSTDDDDSQTTSSDDGERVVSVDLGTVFVSELDKIFGRNDMAYPDNIVTKVNMPVSLLNEINALWIESFMYQLDQQSRQSEMMLRQDEEFARQLALKEEQLAKAGQEPAVPDFKDIMDMELALSIYKKEITAEWRSNEPNDLAARMTREKLYNLFPDVLPEILSELLMAHDNNFQATVEVLLSSTGNAQILEEENGVAKFITRKELERHEKLIEEQKKALSEVEWPLLPKDIKVNMETVQEYRAKASQHWNQRNMYRLRAESYLTRNMPQIASYYSEVAVLHKKKFDHANSLAAASLMQVHAANCTDNATLDLHFLRVLEAKESLDLFLDTHIRKLRELQTKGGPRFHTLFFITGRGIHSHGGPKVKPATKRRLRERGIAYTERNPGLLSSRVSADDKLTHEMS